MKGGTPLFIVLFMAIIRLPILPHVGADIDGRTLALEILILDILRFFCPRNVETCLIR